MSVRLVIMQAYLHIIALILLCLGGISLVSYLQLEQPSRHNVVLLPDSALAAILLGLSLLASTRGWHGLRRCAAGLLLILCSYSLAHNLWSGGAVQGASLLSGFLRIPSPLALTAALLALAMLTSLRGPLARNFSRVVGLGVIGIGIVLASQLAGGWLPMESVRLAFKPENAAIACLFSVFSGVALLLLTFQPAPLKQALDAPSLAAGSLGTLLTGLVWYALTQQNTESLSRESELLLSQAQIVVERTLNDRLALIRRMSERWQALGKPPPERLWQQETGNYLHDTPELQLLGLLDEGQSAYRVRGRDSQARLRLAALLADPALRAWLGRVQHNRLADISQTVELEAEHASLLIAMPLQLPGQPAWLLVASLDISDMLTPLLEAHRDGLRVHIFEGQQQVFGSRAYSTPDTLSPVGELQAQLPHGVVWRLSSHLSQAPRAHSMAYLPGLVLLFGQTFSLLLMLSQRLASLTRERSESLRQANRLLQHNEAYARDQCDILGMISTDQPLEHTLTSICRMSEAQAPTALCSVMLVDEQQRHLYLGAGPSLPADYRAMLNDVAIGPNAGSCGTAVYLRQLVVVEDIASDPLWQDYRAAALLHGLHACWSVPLISHRNELLGSLAIYHHLPMAPDEEQLQLISTAGQLAAIAITRQQDRRRLRESLQELERSNRELQEFAFVASHDLQEPLRKIQTFAERLQSSSGGLDERGRDYLQRMSVAAGRMQSLIRDLLSYSRVASRGRSFHWLSLDQLLDEVLQDLETTVQSSGAQIQREPLPELQGDPSQMRQLLQNLLSNAIKFHRDGEPPRIRVYAERQEHGSWALCVADQGIGFDEKYLSRIFMPFQRLHGRQAYPGTGIGLAIVKKIVERHGARITAHSSPGQGSTFRIAFMMPV